MTALPCAAPALAESGTAAAASARPPSVHELVVWANHRIILGADWPESERAEAVRRLLAARSPAAAGRFWDGVRRPKAAGDRGREMYPLFYVPPYDGGRKRPTLLGQRPGTHILSANAYELEILRLLVLLAPDGPETRDMAGKTLARLRQSCFGGRGCPQGECFDAMLVALRFVAAAAPGETEWLAGLVRTCRAHAAEKRRPWQAAWYFWLCLSELPPDLARPETGRDARAMRLPASRMAPRPVLEAIRRKCLGTGHGSVS